MTLTEAAARLNRSDMTLRRWIKNGKINAVLIDGGRRIDINENEVDRLLQLMDCVDYQEAGALNYRKVYEDYTGTKIPAEHCVHHLNGDPFDRRPQNLVCLREISHRGGHRELLAAWNHIAYGTSLPDHMATKEVWDARILEIQNAIQNRELMARKKLKEVLRIENTGIDCGNPSIR